MKAIFVCGSEVYCGENGDDRLGRETEEIDTLSSARHWDAMELDEPNAGGRKLCPGFIASLGTFSGQMGQGPRCSAAGVCAEGRRLGRRERSGRQIGPRPKRNRGALEFSGTQPGAMVVNSTMTQALRTSEIVALGHGFRSSFKDWARQHDVDELLSEFALAHVEGSATVAAYARDDLLDKRRPVMQRWADCISSGNEKPS